MSYSKIEIIGYLGGDPEMRYTPGGTAVTNFSIASNRKYTNRAGEQVKETAWYRVSAWDRLAEVCNQYLRKGRKVFVVGRLNPDTKTGGPRIWTKENGQACASYDVTALEVIFLDRNNGAGSDANEDHGGEPLPVMANAAEEGIPF